jgi:transcriptional regulator with XRE-family HTH domain
MTGEQLRKHREEAGLTGTEFAARLGCTARSIERYEAGDRKITPVLERAIQHLLDELSVGVSQTQAGTKTLPSRGPGSARKAKTSK